MHRRSRVPALLLALSGCAAGMAGADADVARAAPPADRRFGDSTWVAPAPYSTVAGDPTAAGPRVAPPDRTPPAETALRLPFRVAFFPLRLVARGLEAAAGVVGERMVGQMGPGGPRREHWTLGPLGQYSGSAGPGLGPAIASPAFLGEDGRFAIAGYWTWNDHRRVYARQTVGSNARLLGGRLDLDYRFRPNDRFYGIGNFTSRADRSIFLREEGSAAATLRLGRDARAQLRLIGGYSSISSRRGYKDGPAAADRFSPAEVPYLLRESRLYFYGAGADVAAIDDLRDPTRGAHGHVEARRYGPADDSDVRYLELTSEARAYLPVFARRRVLALQLVHRMVDPEADAGPIPFYRLPESRRELAFAGYKGGRFRDRHLALGHLEYRWLILGPVWALAFAELGEVASRASRLRIADVHESYGGGLRWAPGRGSVFRLEVAKGTEGTHASIDLKGTF